MLAGECPSVFFCGSPVAYMSAVTLCSWCGTLSPFALDVVQARVFVYVCVAAVLERIYLWRGAGTCMCVCVAAVLETTHLSVCEVLRTTNLTYLALFSRFWRQISLELVRNTFCSVVERLS